MAVKFVKAHVANITAGTNGGVLYWMKLLYEFWGFCVNGDNNLRSPGLGSFASFSGSLAPAYLVMAPGFESGTTVLIASGNDGSTAYGSQVFTAPSINWTSGTLLNKWLVTWKSGSTSLDDSIYPIVQILNSQSILVDTNAGATPMSQSKNEPRFTDRGSINFRVIDFTACHNLGGFAAGNYLIFQFNGNSINPGQANSQARIRLLTANNTLTQGAISLSASGSWNGTTFAAANDLTQELVPDGTNTNDDGGGFVTGDWFNGGNGTNYFSLWGDPGGFICHSGGSLSTGPSLFHIEVPKRLFPQNKDPNPICAQNSGKQGLGSLNFNNTQHFGAGWIIHNPFDNAVTRRHHTVARGMGGNNITAGQLYTGDLAFMGQTRYLQAFHNVRTRKYTIQDVLLAHRLATTSYTMGRVQLRLAAFASGPYQAMTKLGVNGEWLAVNQGILWPWDNSQLPRTIFLGGT